MNPNTPYPRDLKGYGRDVPHAQWPGHAKIAVQFVLNFEEGGEACVLHGDKASEVFLSEIVGAQAFEARHLSMESMYEYGSRAGVWRILREFATRRLPLTVFGVGMALQRCPEVLAAFMQNGYEIANHGLRWIHYQHLPEALEREHMALATTLLREMTGGEWPLGWYTGRDSPNTRRLVAEHGGYEYDSDYYGDDLPFWLQVETRVPPGLPLRDRPPPGVIESTRERPVVDSADGPLVPHLVIPYTLDANDMRFVAPQGFNTGDHFFNYLRDTFDALYAEGEESPKMMSVGMHCRVLGKPGRIGALQRFLDHIGAHDRVWVCRRIDIARHWRATHPFDAATAFVWK